MGRVSYPPFAKPVPSPFCCKHAQKSGRDAANATSRPLRSRHRERQAKWICCIFASPIHKTSVLIYEQCELIFFLTAKGAKEREGTLDAGLFYFADSEPFCGQSSGYCRTIESRIHLLIFPPIILYKLIHATVSFCSLVSQNASLRSCGVFQIIFIRVVG